MEIIRLFFAQISQKELEIPQPSLTQNTISSVLQVVFGVAGGVALLIITIAGLQYVLSQGNPQSTAKAKDTILYALIGLIVCILAFSIIGFVFKRI